MYENGEHCSYVCRRKLQTKSWESGKWGRDILQKLGRSRFIFQSNIVSYLKLFC